MRAVGDSLVKVQARTVWFPAWSRERTRECQLSAKSGHSDEPYWITYPAATATAGSRDQAPWRSWGIQPRAHGSARLSVGRSSSSMRANEADPVDVSYR